MSRASGGPSWNDSWADAGDVGRGSYATRPPLTPTGGACFVRIPSWATIDLETPLMRTYSINRFIDPFGFWHPFADISPSTRPHTHTQVHRSVAPKPVDPRLASRFLVVGHPRPHQTRPGQQTVNTLPPPPPSPFHHPPEPAMSAMRPMTPPPLPKDAVECTCPSTHSTASGSPRKHSIDMDSTPVKQHQLEWHVTQVLVGSGKGKKSILNSVGAWWGLCRCVCAASVCGTHKRKSLGDPSTDAWSTYTHTHKLTTITLRLRSG